MIIGNPLVTTNYISDSFSGDASTVAFTLSQAPASDASIAVYISGLYQIPTSAYSISGTTLTFTGAPPTGTNNITVLHLGVKSATLVPVNGSVTPQMLSTANVIYWSASNNNIGIGNVTPTSLLTVTGTAALGNTTITGALNVSTNTATIGTTLYSVANGNIGIGHSSPSVPLAIYKASDSAINIQNSTSGVTNVDGLQLLLSGANGYMWNYENGANIFGTNNTERMRIDSAGNILIGANTAINNSDFLVAGISGTSPVFQGAASGGAYLHFYNNQQTSGSLQIGQGQSTGSDNIGLVWNNANAALTFGTNGTERMRIDSIGRVTMSAQPAFYAYSTGSSMSSGNKVAFNAAPLNVGSSFNTSTNTFTAPIAGNYLFASIVRYDQTGTTYAQTNLMINGLITYQGHYNNVTNANSTYNSVPAIALLMLAAGDTVHVRADISGGGTFSFSGTESLFYGYLLG